MLTQEEKTEMQREKKALQNSISNQESQKEQLYLQNKEKVDLRNSKSSKASTFTALMVISLIAALIGLIFFDGTIKILLIAIGAVLGVAFFIFRVKPAKEVKALSSDLAEYDKTVFSINSKINKEKSRMAQIDMAFKVDQTEQQYSQYIKNHICVYVGESSSWASEPKEKAEHYSNPRETKIYIDGIEYGSSESPFAAFEVTPGPHVVKMEGYTKFGGVDRFVESKAIQVKVGESSAYLFFHWSFYQSNKGLADALLAYKYENIYSFLEDIHKL